MAPKTTRWDGSDGLDDPEELAFYIQALIEDGDPAVLAHGLGNIARSRGMTQIAKETGISRAGLYKALRTDGDPRLSTLLAVLKALGLSLSVQFAAVQGDAGAGSVAAE